jgi:hypothetical protein
MRANTNLSIRTISDDIPAKISVGAPEALGIYLTYAIVQDLARTSKDCAAKGNAVLSSEALLSASFD